MIFGRPYRGGVNDTTSWGWGGIGGGWEGDGRRLEVDEREGEGKAGAARGSDAGGIG